jgi:hypothetical protein
VTIALPAATSVTVTPLALIERKTASALAKGCRSNVAASDATESTSLTTRISDGGGGGGGGDAATLDGDGGVGVVHTLHVTGQLYRA